MIAVWLFGAGRGIVRIPCSMGQDAGMVTSAFVVLSKKTAEVYNEISRADFLPILYRFAPQEG